ncbi:hypothetical protein Fmac_026917 [Flemingia macrophylla]|uniref:Uncharacterized protein n=1 Tax=Flemingia macrophylla TaxID=520843 RepID=A0ABD1LGG9_9FABA
MAFSLLEYTRFFPNLTSGPGSISTSMVCSGPASFVVGAGSVFSAVSSSISSSAATSGSNVKFGKLRNSPWVSSAFLKLFP